jgi:hypothetical protein
LPLICKKENFQVFCRFLNAIKRVFCKSVNLTVPIHTNLTKLPENKNTLFYSLHKFYQQTGKLTFNELITKPLDDEKVSELA